MATLPAVCKHLPDITAPAAQGMRPSLGSERAQIAPDRYRALADEHFLLAQDALSKQERVCLLRSALLWQLAATSNEHPTPSLPAASRLRPAGRLRHEKNVQSTAEIARSLEERHPMFGKALEALPEGSTIAFSADQLRLLLSAGAHIIASTDTYARGQLLAEAYGCSFLLEGEIATFIKPIRNRCRDAADPSRPTNKRSAWPISSTTSNALCSCAGAHPLSMKALVVL
jgi:hypothetical protein